MPALNNIEIVPNDSYLRSLANEDRWCSPEYEMKRRMLNLTYFKLQRLNYPPKRREICLRKSVLIYNTLRCLQQEYSSYDSFEMDTFHSKSNTSSVSRRSDNDYSGWTADDEVDETMDANETDQGSNDASLSENNTGHIEDTNKDDDIENETKAAVLSLLASTTNENEDAENDTNHYASLRVDSQQESIMRCFFEFTSPSGNLWNLPASKPDETEPMDVDHQNDRITPLLPGIIGNSSQSFGAIDTGLITESYHLLENAVCVAGDEQFQFTSYDGAATSDVGNGEYRPFDSSVGFNLLA